MSEVKKDETKPVLVVGGTDMPYVAPVKSQKGYTNEYNPPPIADRVLPSGIVQKADGTHYVPKKEASK